MSESRQSDGTSGVKVGKLQRKWVISRYRAASSDVSCTSRPRYRLDVHEEDIYAYDRVMNGQTSICVTCAERWLGTPVRVDVMDC